MRTRKLKCWNGTLILGTDRVRLDPRFEKGSIVKSKDVYFNVCAYSLADAVELLKEFGYHLSVHYLRTWWSPCWGNSMDGITPERGVWVEFEYGVPTRLILAAG